MSDVNLSISQEVVRPIIEAKIQAAIVAQLADSGQLLQAVVTRVLQQKVDVNGKPDGYYDKNLTYIQYLCESCIRQAATAAVVEAAEKMKPELQKAIVKEIQKRATGLASTMVDYFEQATKSSYNIRANVTLENKSQS